MSYLKKLIAVLCLAVAASAAGAGDIDVNTADAATLASVMHGVGPAKAEAIVAYRDTHGPFRSVDDLLRIKGIGTATLERNRERLTAVQPVASDGSP